MITAAYKMKSYTLFCFAKDSSTSSKLAGLAFINSSSRGTAKKVYIKGA